MNITFKLLVNAHTSMTGGQAIQGANPVANMVSDLLANGVRRVIVTTDEPGCIRRVAGRPHRSVAPRPPSTKPSANSPPPPAPPC